MNRNKEQGILLEILPDLAAYSGTTRENFHTCTLINTREKLWFDKRREPKHAFEETFYTRQILTAITYAMKAKEMGQSPLIIAGKMASYTRYEGAVGRLPVGILFPVERAWILESDFEPIPENFVEINPLKLFNNVVEPLPGGLNAKEEDLRMLAKFPTLKQLALALKDNSGRNRI